MAQRIQSLTPELVHRIAAGEVIDSLGAVVRELIDNALDAQADRLNLVIWPDEWAIQLSDNGVGLSREDLAAAAMPHSTSKLNGRLDRILTLGFRGEALHSLARFGALTVRSRAQQSEAGWQALYDAEGEMIEETPAAIAPGTVVRVQGLFKTWRFRRQTLTPIHQQLKGVQTLIYNYALCHPHVTWQVWQGDRLWFNLPPHRRTQDLIPLLLTSVDGAVLRSRHLVLPPLGDDEAQPQNSLDLVIGLPDRCHRHRPDWIRVAVNGRCVQVHGALQSGALLSPLEQSILRAFRQTLPRHRYPLCFAHFHLNPQYIDWNRHPAKSEIYLRELDHWRSHLQSAIQDLLGFAADGGSQYGQQVIEDLLSTAEKKGQYHLDALGESDLAETTILENPSLEGTENASLLGMSLSDQLPTLQPSLLKLKAIAQLHKTYILCEYPAGLWLVEQHVAHERVLYDELEKSWDFVELTPPKRLKGLSAQQVENLESLGLEIQAFGLDVWVVRTLPKVMLDDEDIVAGLRLLSQTDSLSAALATVACRCAIRNGTTLTRTRMQTLVEAWQRTKMPRTCPHGRPIYLSLEEKDLARFFRRNWMIGS